MPGRNFTDSEEEQIAKLYLAGHSARAIARAYSKSHHISIVAALKRQGVKQRSPAERNRLYQLNPHVFDTIDNELAAYWLGFLYADGCVHKRSLQVSLRRKDESQLAKLKKFLETEAPIKHTLVSADGKKHKRAYLLVTDRHLAEALNGLGVKIGRPNYRLIVDKTPEWLYPHLIRGYFDGDGSARKSQSIAFCGSEPFLVWIRGVMARNSNTNPDLAVTKHSTAELYYLYFSGRLQALNVAEYMYRDATIWMPRKRQVIESWLTPEEKDKWSRYD